MILPQGIVSLQLAGVIVSRAALAAWEVVVDFSAS
jgi:hypothetical protein